MNQSGAVQRMVLCLAVGVVVCAELLAAPRGPTEIDRAVAATTAPDPGQPASMQAHDSVNEPPGIAFSGRLARDDDVAYFQFEVVRAASVRIRTVGYGGGSLADGREVDRGGFDPAISVYDQDGILIAHNDEAVVDIGYCASGAIRPDVVTGSRRDSCLDLALAPGQYTAALTQYDNSPVAPDAQGEPRFEDGFSRTGEANFTAALGNCRSKLFCDDSQVAAGNNRTADWVVEFLGVESAEQFDDFALLSPSKGAFSTFIAAFSWSGASNSAVRSYRMRARLLESNASSDLSQSCTEGEWGFTSEQVEAPQIVLNLGAQQFFEVFKRYEWCVIALDERGRAIAQSIEIFTFTLAVAAQTPTVISGVIKSDQNQTLVAGALVDLDSSDYPLSFRPAVTQINGEYIILAAFLQDCFDQACEQTPLAIHSTRVGFQPGLRVSTVGEVRGESLTPRSYDLTMVVDSDDDGLSDHVEIGGSCLNPRDADTDDDGLDDGFEDRDRDGVHGRGETSGCRVDTDGDGLQDGTERGVTLDDIGVDTDRAVFQPDVDPSSNTDPLRADSDGDGLLDGDEDTNQNGRRDMGESDPGVRDVDPHAWLPIVMDLLLE